MESLWKCEYQNLNSNTFNPTEFKSWKMFYKYNSYVFYVWLQWSSKDLQVKIYVHIHWSSPTCYPLIDFVDSYHQKVAYDPPILELKATYGLAAPETYTPPALNPLWSKEVYEKMNSKMAPKPQEVSVRSKTWCFTYHLIA